VTVVPRFVTAGRATAGDGVFEYVGRLWFEAVLLWLGALLDGVNILDADGVARVLEPPKVEDFMLDQNDSYDVGPLLLDN